ncbi:MAG TPA: hypothetical protein VGE20_17310 [Ramlibacter sp.]
MTVRKTCLKCGHTASVVLYGLATCPRCGALYAKTDEAHAAAQAAAGRAAGSKLALLQLVAVALLVLAGATWFATSYLERQELRAAVEDVVRHGAVISDGDAAAARRAALGEARIRAERLKYRVTITASSRGTEAATIEVTNGSAVTLPYLTLETRRYLNGVLVGATQAPIVITGGIEPGQTRRFAYAPAGDIRATAWSVGLAPVARDDGSPAGLAELRGATGAEKLAANCQAADLAAGEAALQRIGAFGPSGLDLQLKEAAEPLARSRGEAFVRAVAAIAACRNALLTALTVRRHDGGELAVFASEDGWVRLY